MTIKPYQFRLWLASLSAAFGAGFLIYSTYVTNNLQIVGEQWINNTLFEIYAEYPTDHMVTMLWACVIASKEVGKIIGTLLIPSMAEHLGRRGGLLINCLVTFFGCFLCAIAYHWTYHVIMIGRVILGVSMICGVGLASLFLIEVAPIESRGRSGALIQIFRGFGGTMGMVLALPDLLGRPDIWTLALAIPAGPALLQFIVLLFCMESPRHLFITKGDIGRATSAIQFYQGEHRISAAMDDLRLERQRIQQHTSMAFWTMLKTEDVWRPLLLTTLALTNRSLAGILPVQSYSTDMFVAAGIEHNTAAYSTVALGVCHLVSATAVAFTVEKYGRKKLLVLSNIGCLITLLLVALFASIKSFILAKFLTVFFLCVFMLVYPVVASVSNIVASEICHQKIRSYAFTVGLLSYSIVGLVSTFAYPFLKRTVGLSASFMPFCFCLFLISIIYIIWLPETRRKTFESLAFNDKKIKSVDSLQEPLLTPNGNHHHANGNLEFDVEGRSREMSESEV